MVRFASRRQAPTSASITKIFLHLELASLLEGVAQGASMMNRENNVDRTAKGHRPPNEGSSGMGDPHRRDGYPGFVLLV